MRFPKLDRFRDRTIVKWISRNHTPTDARWLWKKNATLLLRRESNTGWHDSPG
jgi:hypothetical protein